MIQDISASFLLFRVISLLSFAFARTKSSHDNRIGDLKFTKKMGFIKELKIKAKQKPITEHKCVKNDDCKASLS